MSYKSDFFSEVLEQFETEEMKLFCIDLLEKRDEINYSIPSSTSYKYHNVTQCQPGGQILHEIMVATVMNYLLGLEYLQQKFDKPKQRDCLRIAAIMHDCKKTNGGTYTVHEHPEVGAQFIITTEVEHDINLKLKKYIGDLIRSHSGQWVDSKRSNLVLPKPDSDDKFLIHLCDFLSSRSNIDMTYSDNIKKLLGENVKQPDPIKYEDYTMPFGKYKDIHITEVPKDYCQWMLNNMDDLREPFKSMLTMRICE